MKTALWIATSILSVMTLASGMAKLARSRQKLIDGGFAWAEDFSDLAVKNIGSLEVLVGLGLVLPGLVGTVTFLVPNSATGVAVLMLADAATHVPAPFLLAAVAAFVAVPRIGAYGL